MQRILIETKEFHGQIRISPGVVSLYARGIGEPVAIYSLNRMSGGKELNALASLWRYDGTRRETMGLILTIVGDPSDWTWRLFQISVMAHYAFDIPDTLRPTEPEGNK